DRDERLYRVVAQLSERIAGNPLKQGIVLDLNPFWAFAYRWTEAGLPESEIGRWPSHALVPYIGAGGGIRDFSRYFAFASEATGRNFPNADKNSPFLLRIVAQPFSQYAGERAAGYDEFRSQLVGAARETPISTVVETLPLAQLIASPGDRVSS